MTTNPKRRQLFESEQDFLDCAHSYLSEAFPNPERQGCPPDETLKVLAGRSTQTPASAGDHLVCCSPCFDAYITHLRDARAQLNELRRIRRFTWIKRSLVAGTVMVLLVAIYVRLTRKESVPSIVQTNPEGAGTLASPDGNPGATNNVRVEIDLSNASPVRGRTGNKTGPLSAQVIPSTRFLDLNVLLPLGSEERTYSVKLRSHDHVIWTGSAKAHQESGQMLLHMQSDLSHVPEGPYELVVISQGFRIPIPVILKNIPSEKIR